MTRIKVSLRDIRQYIDSTRELNDDMRRGCDQASSATSTLESRVNATIEKTNKKIQEMIDDINYAGDVIKHNEIVLEKLEVNHEKLLKQLSAAREACDRAEANQTKANNSSSGSTEEEKKAHDAAVKSANAQLRSAQSDLTSISNAVSQSTRRINNVKSAIQSLRNLIQDINRYRSSAISFINDITYKLGEIKGKMREFISRGNDCCQKVSSYIYKAEDAETYISNGLKRLADVTNTYKEDKVDMSSSKVLLDTANLLRKMKEDSINFAKRHVKSSSEFLEVLGDDVAIATVRFGKEVADKCVEQTKDFDRMADCLISAKRNLDSYASLSV